MPHPVAEMIDKPRRGSLPEIVAEACIHYIYHRIVEGNQTLGNTYGKVAFIHAKQKEPEGSAVLPCKKK